MQPQHLGRGGCHNHIKSWLLQPGKVITRDCGSDPIDRSWPFGLHQPTTLPLVDQVQLTEIGHLACINPQRCHSSNLKPWSYLILNHGQIHTCSFIWCDFIFAFVSMLKTCKWSWVVPGTWAAYRTSYSWNIQNTHIFTQAAVIQIINYHNDVNHIDHSPKSNVYTQLVDFDSSHNHEIR